MLKIGICDGAPQEWSTDETYRMIAEAGFDGVDADLDSFLSPTVIRQEAFTDVCKDEQSILEYAKPLGEAAKKYGLLTHQAHAPFPTRSANPDYDRRLWEIFSWCIHACDAIDCRYLVVHPVTGRRYVDRLTMEQEIEESIKLYRLLIPAAKQYGVTVLTENMFRNYTYLKQSKKLEDVCADIPDACAMLDTLNAEAGAEVFGFCLDTGHMLLLHKDISRAIRQLGSHLKALHIHDNNGVEDQHLGPYMGVQDWDRFISGIAASDYAGVLSFETSSVFTHYDRQLVPAALRFLAQTGRFFARRIEQKRAER